MLYTRGYNIHSPLILIRKEVFLYMQTFELIGGIIITGGIVAAFCMHLYGANKNKQEAVDFLENLANSIYKDMLKLIVSDPDIFKEPLDVAENKILNTIYDTTWDRLNSYLYTAKENGKISDAILLVMNRKFVDKFMDALIERFNIKGEIKKVWESKQTVVTDVVSEIDEDFVEKVEAEDKALQEKFSDETLYNIEEIDEKDLEPVKEGVAFDTDEEGNTIEIQIPEDKIDPVLDTPDDESLEVIGEDGLTDAERNAGIHFNKSGRKIDKKGRYVK
jgi:hypothetical protein